MWSKFARVSLDSFGREYAIRGQDHEDETLLGLKKAALHTLWAAVPRHSGKCPELERKPGNQETCEFMQIMDLSENHGMSLIVFRCLRTSARRTCVFIQLCESFASFFESGNTASWRLQIITNRCSVLGYGCILAEAWRTHERNTGWKLDSDSCDSDISFSLSMSWQN